MASSIIKTRWKNLKFKKTSNKQNYLSRAYLYILLTLTFKGKHTLIVKNILRMCFFLSHWATKFHKGMCSSDFHFSYLIHLIKARISGVFFNIKNTPCS